MNKYLFLDIDDVMVTTRQHHSRNLHPKYITSPFDEKCVNVLNKIIIELNPIIIISSDWRTRFSLDELNEIFYDNGVESEISDFTPDLMGIQFSNLSEINVCRATEILDYVRKNQITNWVAVDDYNLNPFIPNNFVHCNRAYDGISQNGIINKILNILKK